MKATGPFHFPSLSGLDLFVIRSPGPGLGNLLFPLSRALIGQKNEGGTFVFPTIKQVKFGTLLRRERDPRTYADVFRPRKMSEFREWLTCHSLPKVEESHLTARNPEQTIVYSGLKRYFHDLAGNRELIASWIDKNSVKLGDVAETYDIGIHVRLGDFVSSENARTGHSVRQPFEWYERAYLQAKEHLGIPNPKTMLFTDEDPREVANLLRIPGLIFDPSRNAITAIQNLAKARLIITSRSTFSMWSVFLGGAPAIWNSKMDLGASFPLRSGLDSMME